MAFGRSQSEEAPQLRSDEILSERGFKMASSRLPAEERKSARTSTNFICTLLVILLDESMERHIIVKLRRSSIQILYIPVLNGIGFLIFSRHSISVDALSDFYSFCAGAFFFDDVSIEYISLASSLLLSSLSETVISRRK